MRGRRPSLPHREPSQQLTRLLEGFGRWREDAATSIEAPDDFRVEETRLSGCSRPRTQLQDDDSAEKRDVREPGEKSGERRLSRRIPEHVDEPVGVAGVFHEAQALALVEQVREAARSAERTHAGDEPAPEGDLFESRVTELYAARATGAIHSRDAIAAPIAWCSRSTMISRWPSSTMNGGASRMWSPAWPSMVPLIG